MASVLSVPDDSLPADVAAGLPQLMGGLVKLLTSLKQQQACSCRADLIPALDPHRASLACLPSITFVAHNVSLR